MRLQREGRLSAEGPRAAERRLLELRNGWEEVIPGEETYAASRKD